jgi:hypothetical protein
MRTSVQSGTVSQSVDYFAVHRNMTAGEKTLFRGDVEAALTRLTPLVVSDGLAAIADSLSTIRREQRTLKAVEKLYLKFAADTRFPHELRKLDTLAAKRQKLRLQLVGLMRERCLLSIVKFAQASASPMVLLERVQAGDSDAALPFAPAATVRVHSLKPPLYPYLAIPS